MQPFSNVPIPARLEGRPKDSRGLPIPALVLIKEDGLPDFRVTDQSRWLWALAHRRCSMCGQPLGRHLAFVGGPLSHKTRFFTDLPMHRDCAEYALQVCPFLAAPNFRYAEHVNAGPSVRVETSQHVVSTRPTHFFLGVTKGHEPMRLPDGTAVVKAAPWESVQWWQHGAPSEPPASPA